MRRRTLCAATLLPALQIGCALPPPPPPTPVAPNPKLFARPPGAPELQTRGRVALLVKPDVQSTTTLLVSFQFALQSGPMVAQALVLALANGLQGGAQQIDAMPAPGIAFDAVLELRWVQLQFRRHSFPPRTVALSFDLRGVDAQGRTAWSGTYHDARDYPLGEQLTLVEPGESAQETEVRLAHEAAARLAQQVLRDLRAWLVTERLRPREL